jgi:hypothetical protein
MEQIMSIFSFIGQNASKIIPAGAAGAGFLGNWLNQRKTNERQNFLESLSKDPTKMNKYISGFEQPLSKGLTSGVENQVQAALGERGLSSSPTISADVYAQALAPYQQNEQQMAIQAAMNSLGIMPQTAGPTADTSMPLFMLMQALNKKPAPGVDYSSNYAPGTNLGNDGSSPGMSPTGLPSSAFSPFPTDIFNPDSMSSSVPVWGS